VGTARPAHPLTTMRQQTQHPMITEIYYPKRRTDTKRNPGVALPPVVPLISQLRRYHN